MAIRIHHTQIKQAAKLGITLEASDDFVTAKKGDSREVGATAKAAIANLLASTSTADVMKSLKPAKASKPAKKVRKGAKKAKFKCEGCGSTKSESDGEDGRVCAECGEPVETDEDGASVVKKKYKTQYKPHKAKCGDELSKLVTAHVMHKPEGATKPCVDEAKLLRFAKANGCWDPEYAKLNTGMKRMNIVNRLRGKIRRDKHETVWPA